MVSFGGSELLLSLIRVEVFPASELLGIAVGVRVTVLVLGGSCVTGDSLISAGSGPPLSGGTGSGDRVTVSGGAVIVTSTLSTEISGSGTDVTMTVDAGASEVTGRGST